MFRYLCDENGVTLVITMIVILLMTILGAGLISSSVMENKIIHSLQDQKQAFYLAEAGIEYARCRLQQDMTWRTGSYTEVLGAGQFQVVVADAGANQFLITSTGTVNGKQRTLEAGGQYTAGQTVVEQLAEYTLVGGGNVTFYNHVILQGEGNLRSNENIVFDGNTTIADSLVIASGDVATTTIPPSQIEEGQESYLMPLINWDKLKEEAMATGRYMTTWNPALFKNGEVNYIDASVFRDRATEINLDGILVVKGDFSLDARTTIDSNTGLMIIVDGELYFENLTHVEAAIYATGPIKFRNNADVIGTIYSEESVTCYNNINITFDSVPLQQSVLQEVFVPADGGETVTNGTLEFTFWKEM